MKSIVKFVAAAAALVAASYAGAAAAGSLTTDFSTNNFGRSGLYFDLTANHALTITDFVVNGDPGSWSVWYKSGTYAGSETDASAWTLLGSGVTTNTVDTLNVGGLTIGAGQTDGIYIFDYGNSQNYGEQSYNDGIATYSNADLTFQGGTGNYGAAFGAGPFSNTLADRTWSGTVDYLAAGGVPEPAIWAMLLVGVAGLGAAMRMRRKSDVAFAAA